MTDFLKLQKGISAYRNGLIEEAKSIFKKVTSEDPNNETAWLWMGTCVQNTEEKRICFQRVLDINPNNSQATQALLALTSLEMPSMNEMISTPVFQKQAPPIMKDAQSGIFINALNCPMCGSPINKNERECPSCGSVLLITYSGKIFNSTADSKILSEAEKRWKEILRDDPENADANYALGITYLNLHLRDAAEHYLNKAALLAPTSSMVHYNLALALLNENDLSKTSTNFEKAQKEINICCSLAPKFSEAIAFQHYFSGIYLTEINRDEAINEFRKAISTCSTIYFFHYNLGTVLFTIGKKNEAALCFLKALELNPKSFLSNNNLSVLYATEQRWNEAIEYGRNAIECSDASISLKARALTYSTLAHLYWTIGNKREAVEMINKAVSLEPNEQRYRNTLFQFTSQA